MVKRKPPELSRGLWEMCGIILVYARQGSNLRPYAPEAYAQPNKKKQNFGVLHFILDELLIEE